MTRWGKSLVFSLLLCAVCPVAAVAAGEADTGGFGAFRLRGTHGYSLLVLAGSRPGFRHGEVLVFATRGREGALYHAPARVTATTIDGRLGAVGRISVHFEPHGEEKTVRSRCDAADRATYQPGSWVGTIEFEGEEGFTRADVDSAPELTPFFGIGCGVSGGGESWGPGEPGARLLARSATEKRTVELRANKNKPGGRLKLEATVRERKGALSVTRVAERVQPAAGFAYDPALRSAVLEPAAPFSGAGSFHREAKPANRWTGDLAVDLPGRADVRLTGAGFHATLVHARFTRFRPPRPNLQPWLSTRPSPTAFATSSLPGPS